jgi:hypothetical protein
VFSKIFINLQLKDVFDEEIGNRNNVKLNVSFLLDTIFFVLEFFLKRTSYFLDIFGIGV